jgi:hypothetical protein
MAALAGIPAGAGHMRHLREVYLSRTVYTCNRPSMQIVPAAERHALPNSPPIRPLVPREPLNSPPPVLRASTTSDFIAPAGTREQAAESG